MTAVLAALAAAGLSGVVALAIFSFSAPRADLAALRAEMHQGFGELRTEMRQGFAELRADIGRPGERRGREAG